MLHLHPNTIRSDQGNCFGFVISCGFSAFLHKVSVAELSGICQRDMANKSAAWGKVRTEVSMCRCIWPLLTYSAWRNFFTTRRHSWWPWHLHVAGEKNVIFSLSLVALWISGYFVALLLFLLEIMVCWFSRLISQQHFHLDLHTHTQTFNGLFFRTTWVGQYQKDKPFWVLLKQETTGWQWHQLNHMQIISTSLQTDNHASTSSLHIFTGCPSCRPSNSVKELKAKIAFCNPHLENCACLS